MSEAERASGGSSNGAGAEQRTRRTHLPLMAALAMASVGVTIAIGATISTAGLERTGAEPSSNPHADGRIPLPKGLGATPHGANGASDVNAMVAGLEQRVKAGNASLNDVLMLARSYRALEREAESLAMYRQAQTMAPGDQMISLVLASALLRTGNDRDRDEAAGIVDKALADDPTKPEALWLKGLGLIRRHEIDAARDVLKKLDGLVGENAAAKKAVAGLLAELDGSVSSLRAPSGATSDSVSNASPAPAPAENPDP